MNRLANSEVAEAATALRQFHAGTRIVHVRTMYL